MRTLRVALLGAPSIEVDGLPLAVDTRKATAVFALLALSGHGLTRAAIAEMLWPELDGERSRSALRRTLSTLRSGLGDGRLISDRASVSLNLDGAWFDLGEFRAVAGEVGADAATLAAAADLHRGDLLEGFGLRDAVQFDDWQRDAQDAVRRERAALLDRLIERLDTELRPEDAIVRARERLALDGLHEPTHRRLIELYAAVGRRGDAFEQYRECVRVLDRELGVQPLSATTELYNAISAGIELREIEQAPAQPAGELPLVGRADELTRLLDAFAAIDRDGHFALVEGESGVGKTRLAEEAIQQLRRRGVGVLTGQPHAGERGLAYGVMAQLLRAACADRPPDSPTLRSEAARLLPDLGVAPVSALDEPGARLRFLESMSSLIADAFGEAAGVVFVDDLHLCDAASLDALAYLARRLEGRRLLILGARRTDEPDPDHRCASLAVLAERIVLARLARENVLALARRSGLDESAADQLFLDTDGLPLFVAELLGRGGGAGGGGVRAALEARLDEVSEAGTQVLAAAALIGRAFDADIVRSASGRSDDEVVVALDELTTRGLIVERDEAYDFGHERLRAIAEERVGLARRRLLHHRIADALLARRADPAIVARHLELAGRDDEAALAHAAAGESARGLLAGTEAIAHFGAAIALGHAEKASLYEAIGDVSVLRGEYRDALAAYDAAGAAGVAADRGRLEQKVGAVHERRGDWQLAASHYEQALALGADPPSVQADRSRVAWRQGDAVRARAIGLEALALAEQAADPRAAAQAHNILGLVGEGRTHLEESLAIATELDDAAVRIAALNNLARDLTREGDLVRARELLGAALELCRRQGDLHHEAALHNNLADVLHKAGASDEAMEELKSAVAVFARIGAEDEELRPGVWSLADW